jgi:hypothetical protein
MSTPMKKRPIGSLFVEKGFVTQEELDDALREQKESGQRLGEILVERGHISRIDLASVIGSQLGELRVLRGGLAESTAQSVPDGAKEKAELEQRLANQAESIDQLLDRINELETYAVRLRQLETELAAAEERRRTAEARLAAGSESGGAASAPLAQLVYAETTDGYRMLSFVAPAPACADAEPGGAEPGGAERLVVVDRVDPVDG